MKYDRSRVAQRYSMQHQTISGLISTTFSLSFGNFLKLALIVLMLYSPIILLSLFMQPPSAGGSFGQQVPISPGKGLLFLVLVAILAPLYVGSVVSAVARAYQGKPASIGECVSSAFGKLLSLLGAGILFFLAMYGVAILGAIVMVMMMAVSPILGIVGAGIMIYLILKVTASLCLCFPVIMVEGEGAMASLKRSAQLTRGSHGKVIGTFFLLGLILFGAIFLLMLVFGMLLKGGMAGGTVGIATILFMIIYIAAMLFSNIVWAVTSVVIYFDMRSSKESFGLDEMLKVFD